jgi:hypothetical protein
MPRIVEAYETGAPLGCPGIQGLGLARPHVRPEAAEPDDRRVGTVPGQDRDPPRVSPFPNVDPGQHG